MSLRYPLIDAGRLPLLEVVEIPDFDALVAARMAYFKGRWAIHDPPMAAQYDADALQMEFDPAVIVMEASSEFERMLRDRVNQAARQVTLVYAIGANLEGIASRYPGGVPRMASETYLASDDPIERRRKDSRYARRIVMSANALSPHGSPAAYAYWAMTANGDVRDATAVAVEGTANVTVTIMMERDANAAERAVLKDPVPTDAELLGVRAFILGEARKATTDVLSVIRPGIVPVHWHLDYTLFPGAPQATVHAEMLAALESLRDGLWYLGMDHTHSALHEAARRAGVHKVTIRSPATDVAISPRQLGSVTKIDLVYKGRGE